MNADRMEDVIRRRLVVDERSLKRLAKRVVDLGGVLPLTDTPDTPNAADADAAASSDSAVIASSYEDFQIDAAAFRSSLRRLHHQLRAQAADQSALEDERASIETALSAASAQVGALHESLAIERRARAARRAYDRAVRDLQRCNLPTRVDGERGLKALRQDIKAAKLAKGNLQRAWTRRERLFAPVLAAVRQYGEDSVREPNATTGDNDRVEDNAGEDVDVDVDGDGEDDAGDVDAGNDAGDDGDGSAESMAGTAIGDAEQDQTSTPAQNDADRHEGDVAMSDVGST